MLADVTAARAPRGRHSLSVATRRCGAVWFGLAFYDSEGETGVGCVGCFDPHTGKVELRRLPLLRGWSSAALFSDGPWLWLATYRYAEGDEPAMQSVTATRRSAEIAS